MKRITLSFALTAALMFSICTLPVIVGFKGCSKQQTEATIQDAIDTLDASESEIVSAFPNVKDEYQQLRSWAVDIKAAIAASDSLKAKSIIKSFLPLFDKVLGLVGVKKKSLALVDIAIHVVLNHLPANTIVVANGKQKSAAIKVEDNDDSIIIEYSSRPVWGCQYLPKRCQWP
jgi:hypothetical protein